MPTDYWNYIPQHSHPKPQNHRPTEIISHWYLVFQVLDFLVSLQRRKYEQTDDQLYPVNNISNCKIGN